VDDGTALFEAARAHDLEGIMSKQRDSKYTPGRRTDCWLKVKVRQSAEVVIVGYTKGKGDRGASFGALQIAANVNGELVYRGKVGTGFDDKKIKEIVKLVGQLPVRKSAALKGNFVDPRITTWIEPALIAEVSYSRLTPDQMFREPVFLRLRPDMSL